MEDPSLLKEHRLSLIPFGAELDCVDRKEHVSELVRNLGIVGGVVIDDQHVGVSKGVRELLVNSSWKLVLGA